MSIDWEERYPNFLLRYLVRDCSGHAPLILTTNTQSEAKKRFHFELIWPRYLGYLEAVATAWQDNLPNSNAFRNLDFKLQNMAKSLQGWSKKFVGNIRLQLTITKEVMLQLDTA